MFTLFRYGLVPVVLYCVIVITAGIDVFLTNTVHANAIIKRPTGRSFDQRLGATFGKR
jgi:hypothetical protein